MKKNWKSDNISPQGAGSLHPIFIGLVIVLLISSCEGRIENTHISTSKTSELDGLARPTTQTVFSDVKAIFPIRQTITPIIHASGVIAYDPRSLNNISARFNGRIEKLYVRFNFVKISKGQRIMDIYSPEILTAQQNLIYLLKQASFDMELLKASERKLQLLGMTAEQLKQIESSGQPINPLPVYSAYSGHLHDIGISAGSYTAPASPRMSSGMNSITYDSPPMSIENLPSSSTSALSIKEGMYVESGQPIFAVYNTNQVLAVINIFPHDAGLVKEGDKISITVETNPTKVIPSSIAYIEPVAGQNASAIKARVYLQNAEELHLEIGTLLSSNITPRGIDGLWLPRTAVVNLGQNQIVFLKTENHFISKSVQTGILTDSLIEITGGLNVNEQVAGNAQFLVDSESFTKSENNGQQ